ncbi:MAG: hypothetical protein QNJ00_08195 [Woeseiaceae bacterium]|nr:hypothetical protein [Woeseiaceae bacterium]
MNGNWRLSRTLLGRVLIMTSALLVMAGTSPYAAAQSTALPELDRTSIEVSDLERALTLYRDALGFVVDSTIEHPETSAVRQLVGNDARGSVRETLLSSRAGIATLGLVEAVGRSAADPAGATLRLEIPGFDEVIGRAKALGLTVLPERSSVNVHSQPTREQVIVDWDGNRIVVYALDFEEVVVGDCVEVGTLQRWKVFDDRQIFVEGSEPGTLLLLTMRARCRGALYSRLFEIPNETGRICRDDGRIAYRDAGLRRTCSVETFEIVPDLEEATRRANERRGAAQYQ